MANQTKPKRLIIYALNITQKHCFSFNTVAVVFVFKFIFGHNFLLWKKEIIFFFWVKYVTCLIKKIKVRSKVKIMISFMHIYEQLKGKRLNNRTEQQQKYFHEDFFVWCEQSSIQRPWICWSPMMMIIIKNSRLGDQNLMMIIIDHHHRGSNDDQIFGWLVCLFHQKLNKIHIPDTSSKSSS